MKSWLHDNGTEIYLKHKEGKPVIAKRFIRILKNKIYKNMIIVSKDMCTSQPDKIVDKYCWTYQNETCEF